MRHPFKNSRPVIVEKDRVRYPRPRTQRYSRWRHNLLHALPHIGSVIALFVVAVYVWSGYSRANHHKYCLIMHDEFSLPQIDEKIWDRQVQLGGFGTFAFDWTTASDSNSYINNGQLYITPTVTEDQFFVDGAQTNLTLDGTCSSSATAECFASTNVTAKTIVNPVKSARLTTSISKAIKYGRVEVKAKLPRGDWLWPAIWMMPRDSVYGEWPASGEIDIMESRGNDKFQHYGRDTVMSALHWGPASWLDRYAMTTNYLIPPRSSFQEFHTFGLEWTPEYIKTYLDSKLIRVYQLNFPVGGLWSLGQYYSSGFSNPWATGTKNAPFDQEFYLILNVAVGGVNGFFPEDMPGKPWTNSVSRDQAMIQFHEAQDSWLPTWGDRYDRSMIVDSVSMWQQCD